MQPRNKSELKKRTPFAHNSQVFVFFVISTVHFHLYTPIGPCKLKHDQGFCEILWGPNNSNKSFDIEALFLEKKVSRINLSNQ